MVIPYLLEEWQREADIVTKDEQGIVKAVGNYFLKQTLGKGSMGKVKLGVHVTSGAKAAIKIVPRAPRLRKLTAKEISREIRAVREGHLMMLLNHPHIVHLRDMIAGSHYYYFLMDFVSGGQLLHYIVKRDRLTEKHARHFSRQIVSALDYMHRNSVVHRDLKIENILVDKTGHNIKIIDFGLSNLFCPERQLTTYCGSLYFAAPELLNGCPYRGPEIDVWSFGVVLYVMITGSVPFDDKSLPGLHEKIKRAQIAYPAHISSSCHNLLSRIFVSESQQRITLADIILHPWLNEGHSNYIQNHLPYREPLSLPLDETVLQHMTYGFNLGSIEDIRMKLEVILQSSVYRISATHVSEVQLNTLNQLRKKRSSLSSSASSSNSSTLSKCNSKKKKKFPDTLPSPPPVANHIIWGSYNDPQNVPAAYHPLLSIYYLTRERLQLLKETKIQLQKNKIDYPVVHNYSNKNNTNNNNEQNDNLISPSPSSSNSPQFVSENINNSIVAVKQPSIQQQDDIHHGSPNIETKYEKDYLENNDDYQHHHDCQYLQPISNSQHHQSEKIQRRQHQRKFNYENNTNNNDDHINNKNGYQSPNELFYENQFETKLPLPSPIVYSISPTPTTNEPLPSIPSTPLSPTDTTTTTLSKEKANFFMKFSSLFKKKEQYNAKRKLNYRSNITDTKQAKKKTIDSTDVVETKKKTLSAFSMDQDALIKKNEITPTHHQHQQQKQRHHHHHSFSTASSSSSTACISINPSSKENSIIKHTNHKNNNIHHKNSGWIARRLNAWIDNTSILNRHVS